MCSSVAGWFKMPQPSPAAKFLAGLRYNWHWLSPAEVSISNAIKTEKIFFIRMCFYASFWFIFILLRCLVLYNSFYTSSTQYSSHGFFSLKLSHLLWSLISTNFKKGFKLKIWLQNMFDLVLKPFYKNFKKVAISWLFQNIQRWIDIRLHFFMCSFISISKI